MDDQQFRQLLDHFGYSCEGYRRVRKGAKKRISSHMQQLGCRGIVEYLQFLDKVSRFFRDRNLWKIIEDQILPKIIKENRKKVKVWSAGCACGEEVYSFKILWESLRGRLDPVPELEIWATDINPVYLRRAQDGMYPLSSLKEVPQELREIYFIHHEEGGLYRIAPSLKKEVS